nr:P1 [Potato virus B]
MAMTIMIGSIEVTTMNSTERQRTIAPQVVQQAANNTHMWEALRERLDHKLKARAHGTIVADKRGTLRIRRASKRHVSSVEKQMMAAYTERQVFMAAPDSIVNTINFAGTTPPSMMQIEEHKGIHTTARMKKTFRKRGMFDTSVHKACVKTTTYSVSRLIKAVCNIAKKNNLAIEISGKQRKPIRGKIVKHKVGHVVTVDLAHHSGQVHRRDLIVRPDVKGMFHHLCSATKHEHIHANKLDRGSSGMVLYNEKLSGVRMRTQDEFLIVRGRCEGILMDARSKLTFETMLKTVHY